MKLISKENKIFEVKKEIIKQKSKMIDKMLSNDDENEELRINVDEKTLEKIIEYVEHNFNKEVSKIEKPLKSNKMIELTDEWNANFIDSFEQSDLFNLILSADYLDISSLLDLGCAKIASMIKNKTPEEIRKTFNIKNDFTPEEEESIIKENVWID